MKPENPQVPPLNVPPSTLCKIDKQAQTIRGSQETIRPKLDLSNCLLLKVITRTSRPHKEINKVNNLGTILPGYITFHPHICQFG